MLAQVAEKIQEYTEAIKMGKLPTPSEICPRCQNKPGGFKLHDHRERTFLVIVQGWVEAVVTLLVRFKCTLCKKTFTWYPDFALPYKHYALPVVVGLSEKYLNNDVSYRNACREGQCYLGYSDERFLEGTTVWRWVGYMGGLAKRLNNALAMIQQKYPATGVFRKLKPVPCGKYRSEKRLKVLQTAWQLLWVEQEYRKLFGRTIFPRLALSG